MTNPSCPACGMDVRNDDDYLTAEPGSEHEGCFAISCAGMKKCRRCWKPFEDPSVYKNQSRCRECQVFVRYPKDECCAKARIDESRRKPLDPCYWSVCPEHGVRAVGLGRDAQESEDDNVHDRELQDQEGPARGDRARRSRDDLPARTVRWERARERGRVPRGAPCSAGPHVVRGGDREGRRRRLRQVTRARAREAGPLTLTMISAFVSASR